MIQRRWFDTLFMMVVGGGLCAWAWSLSESTMAGAGIAAVFGIGAVVTGLLGPASGPCPLCDTMLHGFFALALGSHERCPHCCRYFDPSTRLPIADDFVASSPTFAVPLGDDTHLPSVCCVCASPAIRADPVTHKTQGAVSHASPIVMTTEVNVSVPYCDAHRDEVTVTCEDQDPALGLLAAMASSAPSSYRWVLKVRSHRFYQLAMHVAGR